MPVKSATAISLSVQHIQYLLCTYHARRKENHILCRLCAAALKPFFTPRLPQIRKKYKNETSSSPIYGFHEQQVGVLEKRELIWAWFILANFQMTPVFVCFFNWKAREMQAIIC
jgi:hypothetical protein